MSDPVPAEVIGDVLVLDREGMAAIIALSHSVADLLIALNNTPGVLEVPKIAQAVVTLCAVASFSKDHIDRCADEYAWCRIGGRHLN